MWESARSKLVLNGLTAQCALAEGRWPTQRPRRAVRNAGAVCVCGHGQEDLGKCRDGDLNNLLALRFPIENVRFRTMRDYALARGTFSYIISIS